MKHPKMRNLSYIKYFVPLFIVVSIYLLFFYKDTPYISPTSINTPTSRSLPISRLPEYKYNQYKSVVESIEEGMCQTLKVASPSEDGLLGTAVLLAKTAGDVDEQLIDEFLNYEYASDFMLFHLFENPCLDRALD